MYRSANPGPAMGGMREFNNLKTMEGKETIYLRGMWKRWEPLEKLEKDLTMRGFELYDDGYYQKYSENHEFIYRVMIVESKQYLYGVMFMMCMKTYLGDISADTTVPGYDIENICCQPRYLWEIYMGLFNCFSRCISKDLSITFNDK